MKANVSGCELFDKETDDRDTETKWEIIDGSCETDSKAIICEEGETLFILLIMVHGIFRKIFC